MIIIGSRVSVKVGNSIPNSCGSNFRWIRKRVFSNIANSVSDNRHKIKFDDSTTKEAHSNSLQIEDSSSGIPLSEVIATVVEATDDNGTQQASKVNTNPDIEETKDFTFLIDSTSIDSTDTNTTLLIHHQKLEN